MTNFKMAMTAVGITLLILLFSSCGKVGPKGPAGDPGTSVVGQQGPEGTPGAAGPTGPQGSSWGGWTVVQLCPNCVPTYPSTFAEIAWCYRGSLYGTYSANGGFSSMLPPGAYSSDGINCSCNFVIEPDCQVTLD